MPLFLSHSLYITQVLSCAVWKHLHMFQASGHIWIALVKASSAPVLRQLRWFTRLMKYFWEAFAYCHKEIDLFHEFHMHFGIYCPGSDSTEGKDDASNVVGAGEHMAGAHETFIEVQQLQKGLCGASRPHFFRGVATVRASAQALQAMLSCLMLPAVLQPVTLQ